MEVLAVGVVALLVVAAATAISPRIGVSSPLLLTLLGIVVSLLPFVPAIVVDPEVILAGILPPLLYSAAVSLPAMEFRRDFGAISGLSVTLVLITSVVLGLVFAWLIPELGLAGGIALGAILSPTDAVATSIVKRVGVSARVTAMLDGESLLNDATALVVLRAAIAAIAASVSIWSTIGTFVYAVLVAVAVGLVVGWLNLRVRRRVEDAAVNTVISIAVPFVASIPAEELGASGLVAAVVAGIVTGRGAVRHLSAEHRLSDTQTWRTIELVLEGAVFLIVGLELTAIVEEVGGGERGVLLALGLAGVAFAALLVVRAAWVALLLCVARLRTRRNAAVKDALVGGGEHRRVDAVRARAERLRDAPPARQARFRRLVRRRRADLEYDLAEPLGWREGTLLVWAGMRGAVTLAAAQTLPAETPSRSVLVFVAFIVAVGSLLVQGGTLGWIARRLGLVRPPDAGIDDRRAISDLLRRTGSAVLDADDVPASVRRAVQRYLDPDPESDLPDSEGLTRLRTRMIEAQRAALIAARDAGAFGSAPLAAALETLDAEQIALEMRAERRREHPES